MATKLVKLTFVGPVHFGRTRLTDGAYACDAATLFSALFIEALRDGSQDALLAAARQGDLMLSDAFPYIGKTLYLPKPMVGSEVFDERNKAKGDRHDSRERKANKKLSFVPADQYAAYLAGDFDALSELERFDLGKPGLQTKVNLLRDESDDAMPYFVGSYSFNPGAGLYFLAQGSYDLMPLLELLSYAGLGGKRTSGYGRFTFSVEETDVLKRATAGSPKTGSSVLLASATPREDELSEALLTNARYRLVRKGGFVQSTTYSDSPRKKRDLYLFAAGSTFAREFEGDVFDVGTISSSHPVYRYARAMWMAV